MSATRRKDRSGEVRLEGVGLVLVGGVILAAVVGAFFLGAWVERRAHPPGAIAAGIVDDPLGPLELGDDVRDAGDGMDAFDRMAAADAEPEREIVRELPPADAAPALEADSGSSSNAAGATPAAGAPAGGAGEAAGPFWAQVFAGRDRRAADRLASELEGSGYPVRIASIPQGSSTLYKVRVGGYPDEARARSIARELVRNGYAGTWVTRIDG